MATNLPNLTLPPVLTEELIRSFPAGPVLNALLLERFFEWTKVRVRDQFNAEKPAQVMLVSPALRKYMLRAELPLAEETQDPVEFCDSSTHDYSGESQYASRLLGFLVDQGVRVIVDTALAPDGKQRVSTITLQEPGVYVDSEGPFPLAASRAALLLWFFRQPENSPRDYVDPILFQEGIFLDKSDYDAFTDRTVARVKSGEIPPHTPDEDETDHP